MRHRVNFSNIQRVLWREYKKVKKKRKKIRKTKNKTDFTQK